MRISISDICVFVSPPEPVVLAHLLDAAELAVDASFGHGVAAAELPE